MALSPMMQQYNRIKEEHMDCLLMFRLGDFYELFFDDAIIAARDLELALTGRNCGLEEKAPMCGVPHHAAEGYITKLVKLGHKVAICEQLEDPKDAKGIVERDVIRVITPGTLDFSGGINSSDNVYIASVFVDSENTGLAFADISTGELFCMSFDRASSEDLLASEISKYMAKEVICQSACKDYIEEELDKSGVAALLSGFEKPYFHEEDCTRIINNHFNVSSLISLGIDGDKAAICAVGSLLMYLIDTQKQSPNQITELVIKNVKDSMQLDRSTIRNLELLETLYDGETKGSLFGTLNRTKTAMGARLLKSFLKEPLKDASAINNRLDAVECFCSNQSCMREMSESLKHVYDFQRLTARIASKRANAKDLVALKVTLGELPAIHSALQSLDSVLVNDICNNIGNYDELYNYLDRAIVDEPPHIITNGGIIKDGFSDKLDELKASIKDAKLWIAGLEASERERTGIKTIKVGYNKVFGYYLDVSKGMTSKVPEDYIRKQTLVNNERYITPELKDKESLVLTAEVQINKLEYELFAEIRNTIEPYIVELQKASYAIALTDVLISFAKVSIENNYVKPLVNKEDLIDIQNGRHPTVEKLIGAGLFVANDTLIDNNDRNMLIITGPNMAGKSTYMRQTAIIVLMAQIGCFVPCDKATIGVVDRVFTRIGASDNLSHGQSTFFIEMSELANILRNATSKSLIILDEIGRGTSTFDGLSIAWATCLFLCKQENCIRTMFATHYHELTDLASEYDNIHNLSVSVTEDQKNVVFLHNIIDGPASKSYGIHVAKLAGVPLEIRQNAAIKLRELEAHALKADEIGKQLSFLEDKTENSYLAENVNSEQYEELSRKILSTDINSITPIKAMTILSDLIDDVKLIRGDLDD